MQTVVRACIRAAFVALGAVVVGCGAPTLKLVSPADSTVYREWILLGDRSTHGNATDMGPVAANVGSAELKISNEHVPFLFAGDLEAGIPAGALYRLPTRPASTDDALMATVPTPSTWTSFRVYDTGLCSVLVPWSDVAENLVGALDRGFARASGIRGVRRTAAASVTPILRMRRQPHLDRDRVRVQASYHADRVSDPKALDIGCNSVRFDIDFEIGLQKVGGGVSHAPACRFPSESGGISTRAVGTDFGASVESLRVSARSSRCVVIGDIEDGIAGGLTAALPSAVASAIRDRLLIDPTMLGYGEDAVRPCRCDIQCDYFAQGGSAYVGDRHRCRIENPTADPPGRCFVQIEPDRVNVRPDGLEIILAEDRRDEQFQAFGLAWVAGGFCNPSRPDRAVSAGAAGQMPGAIQVPVP